MHQRENAPRRSSSSKAQLIGAALATALSLVTGLMLLGIWLSPLPQAPQFLDIQKNYKSSERLILDRDGELIHETRSNRKVRRLNWTKYSDISPHLFKSVIKAEDKRFVQHNGVDFLAMGKAVLEFIQGNSLRGASTITMQVAKALMKGDRISRTKNRFGRKLLQIWLAKDLEAQWSKNQIMESYLNLIYFRGELQGIEAASYGLFQKSPLSLDSRESNLLAVLIRAPNASLTRIAKRACQLAGKAQGCKTYETLIERTIAKRYQIERREQLIPHLAQKVSRHHSLKSEAVVRTTLDKNLQELALQSIQNQISLHRKSNMRDGAVVVIENKTGNVLAYVGNTGKSSSAPYVDGVTALRQAGSTLKPFLFARALDRKVLTASSVLVDLPVNIALPRGVYRPENYDRKFRKFATLRTSLAASLNIPSVRTIDMIGSTDFVEILKDLGISSLLYPEYYGSSLALGAADISLWDLANAYRALANGGQWSPVRFYSDQTRQEGSRQVLSPQASFIIKDILSDREARATTFGLENMLATGYWSAVKTGTSKDMRDNWCVGFSDKYTVGVWAGNFSGQPMWNVSGIHGAAPVWLEVMNYLHRDETSRAPVPPQGLARKKVKFEFSGATKNEWYLAGTEPNNSLIKTHLRVSPRIQHPIAKSVIAIDPDIPLENSRLFFKSTQKSEDIQWKLNGEIIGNTKEVVKWTPKTGRHKLQLVELSGKVLDQVRFSVR